MAAGTTRNVVLPLVDLEAKQTFVQNANRPFSYIANYHIKVEGRESLTASTSIELAFLSNCPEKTITVSSCL